jgi:hypothetical protein
VVGCAPGACGVEVGVAVAPLGELLPTGIPWFMTDFDVIESGSTLLAFPTVNPATDTLKSIKSTFLNNMRLFFIIFFKFPTNTNFDHICNANSSSLLSLD